MTKLNFKLNHEITKYFRNINTSDLYETQVDCPKTFWGDWSRLKLKVTRLALPKIFEKAKRAAWREVNLWQAERRVTGDIISWLLPESAGRDTAGLTDH